MKQYDYILFDWDGTIAKTLDIWMEALRGTLEKRGYNFTNAQVGADYGLFRSRFSNLGEVTLDEIVDEALSALSAIKSRTIMVGDSDKDIISAQNAGIDSILFYPPEHSRFHDITYLRSLRPTYVIGSYQEIGSLLI